MNRDLQATHQILSLLERSKFVSDDLLDQLSGLFINMNLKGQILRANLASAPIFGAAHETLLGQLVTDFFSAKNKVIFNQHFAKVVQSHLASTQFQLDITIGTETKNYSWEISELPKETSNSKARLFTCTGKDVTELLKAHQQAISLRKDVELVETVQNLFLPLKKARTLNRLSVAYQFYPATISSGDFVWYEFASDQTLWLFLGDVTGHGAGAAMVTALIRGSLETIFSLHTQLKIPMDAKNIFTAIQKNLSSLPGQPFWLTCTLMQIDPGKGCVSWWGASPPAFYCVEGPGQYIEPPMESSSPLGQSDVSIAEGVFAFSAGQKLVLMTDGILERQNRFGQQFVSRELKQFLQKESSKYPAAECCLELKKCADNWSQGLAATDDATIVIVDWL